MKHYIRLYLYSVAILCLFTNCYAFSDIPLKDETLRHYDKQGRMLGKSVRKGNEVREFDKQGRFVGKKIISKDEIRSYDKQGKLTGKSKK